MYILKQKYSSKSNQVREFYLSLKFSPNSWEKNKYVYHISVMKIQESPPEKCQTFSPHIQRHAVYRIFMNI